MLQEHWRIYIWPGTDPMPWQLFWCTLTSLCRSFNQESRKEKDPHPTRNQTQALQWIQSLDLTRVTAMRIHRNFSARHNPLPSKPTWRQQILLTLLGRKQASVWKHYAVQRLDVYSIVWSLWGAPLTKNIQNGFLKKSTRAISLCPQGGTARLCYHAVFCAQILLQWLTVH
jgi:hypothetical protein